MDVVAGGEAQLLALGRLHDRLQRPVVRVAREPHQVCDAVDGERARGGGRAHRVALGLVQGVHHRRALRRAHGDPRLLLARAPRSSRGREHAEVGELVLQCDRLDNRHLRVVGHDDDCVLPQELLDPAARVEHSRELQVGLGDRVHLPLGPVLVRVPVVVWEREQEEVEEVVLDEVGGHAARVAVANAGHPQPRAAARRARGEDVGVEELARAEHGVAHERGGYSRERGVALRVVAMAPAVHQIRRPGGAHAGVVERLEHRRRPRGQVCAVHVVDRVG